MVIASSPRVVDRRFEPLSGQIKRLKFVFAVSPLRTYHLNKCLPVNCCFSELPLEKSKITCWSSTILTSSYQYVACSHHDTAITQFVIF